MTAMLSALKRHRAALDAWLTERGLAHTFALPVYQLHRNTLPWVEAEIAGASDTSGPCLDAGAGRSPWRPILEARGVKVVSLDVEKRSGEVDLVADLQDMPEVGDATMGSVLCTQVLEHLPRPWDAISEIARVLVPGGRLILSVPHLSMLHEIPHDYFRYTRYGLASLLDSNGFEEIEIRESGGLVSFLCHAASMAWMTTVGAVPGLRWAAWAVNYTLLVRAAALLDALIGARRLYPCNYVVRARRSGA